jgi:hypothetical protein
MQPDDLTPVWFSTVLAGEISAVKCTPIGVGMVGLNLRCELLGDGNNRTSVVVKLPSDPCAALLPGLVGCGVRGFRACAGRRCAHHAWKLLRSTNEVLLESTPAGLDIAELTAVINGMDGVEHVHDLHVWSLSSDIRALSAHVVLDGHPTWKKPRSLHPQSNG